MTTEATIETFRGLYRKCIVRDTPLPIELARTEFTAD